MGSFACLLLTAQATAGTLTISDGDFEDADYTGADVTASGVASASASTLPAGGDPGALREISLTVDPFSSIVHAEMYDPLAVDPASSGEILSVGFSVDLRRTFTSTPAASQVTARAVVEQGGVFHTHTLGINATTDWMTFSSANLVPLLPGVDWATGGPVRFGFAGSVATMDTPFTINGGYDNLDVVIQTVPEPSHTLLLLTGGVLLLACTGRRALQDDRSAARVLPKSRAAA